ncbi:MAG: ATP-binding protein [Ruminococcus sp.]|nr:ATP-binding protein [Ruminococcus sp.]
MNNYALNQAFDIIEKRHAEAISEYENRIRKVEKEIPEIAHLNSQIANTSREVIIASLTKDGDVKSRIEEIKRVNQYAQNRIAELLISHRYPKDFLNMHYHCPKCSDTGYIDNDYCECVNTLVNKINADTINKNSFFKNCTFESFNLDYYSRSKMVFLKGHNNQVVSTYNEYEYMQKVFDFCKKYAENFQVKNSEDLLIFGGTGVGKTHISLAMGKKIMEAGFSVIYNSALDLFSSLEKERFSNNNNFEISILDGVLNADLLIIDDLGIEMDNKFYKSVLYNIINTRYIKSLPTIINTNLNLNGLDLKYEERIFSRLYSYHMMEFQGNDYRIASKDNRQSIF